MATKTYFLLLPVSRQESPTFITLPTRSWRSNAMEIGPALGCRYVERFQARLGVTGLLRYVWVDEEGHCTGKPINQYATATLYPGAIAGPAAIELGAFDLASPEDAAKWDKLMARVGPDLRTIHINIPQEVPV